MRYVIIAAVLLVCIGAAVFFTRRFSKRHSLPKWARPLVGVIFTLIPAAAVFVVYINIDYKPDSEALSALESKSGVTVTKADGWYFFDGSGTDTAIIFYPGAKVEAEAYAPMMHELAERGVDCFLPEMRFDLAIFDIDKANEIKANYSYSRWYLAGHSMGGAAAANYCAENSDNADGLILMAAYSVKELDDSLSVLSVYGSEDGVLNMDNYSADKANLPAGAEELVIGGGNHGQFGSYGEQRGDRRAGITAKSQRLQTEDAVIKMIEEDKLRDESMAG